MTFKRRGSAKLDRRKGKKYKGQVRDAELDNTQTDDGEVCTQTKTLPPTQMETTVETETVQTMQAKLTLERALRVAAETELRITRHRLAAARTAQARSSRQRDSALRTVKILREESTRLREQSRTSSRQLKPFKVWQHVCARLHIEKTGADSSWQIRAY